MYKGVSGVRKGGSAKNVLYNRERSKEFEHSLAQAREDAPAGSPPRLLLWSHGIMGSRRLDRAYLSPAFSRFMSETPGDFCLLSSLKLWTKSVIMNRIKRKLKELHSVAEAYAQESLSQDDLEECGLQGIHLRGYQLEGVKWMKRCFECGHGCILGDEMGLGKTIQVGKLSYVL